MGFMLHFSHCISFWRVYVVIYEMLHFRLLNIFVNQVDALFIMWSLGRWFRFEILLEIKSLLLHQLSSTGRGSECGVWIFELICVVYTTED